MFFIFEKISKNGRDSLIEREQTKTISSYLSFASGSVRSSLGAILCLITLIGGSAAWSQNSFPTVTAASNTASEFSTVATEQFLAPMSIPVTLDAEEYNPFDDSQLETWVLQGQQSQEAGNHKEATIQFAMAWQASRVTNGLYHPSQLPLLESMIVSEIELEDWQAVDDHYSYIELLLNRLYDEQDPRLEAGLQAVSSWHVNAFNLNLDGRQEQHLRQAHKILKQRLEVAENTLPADDPKFEFLNEGIRLSETYLYLMSERYKQQLRKQEQAERDRLLATLN